MSLSQTKAAFARGAITKPQYIEEMHAHHTQLFKYARFMTDTDIAKIEITPNRVVMTFKETGVKMICDEVDRRIAPIEALNFGTYEGGEAALVVNLIEPGAQVFDIGANVGWYSLHIAKICRNVTVHSFEPVPETFHYLTENIALNDAHNVTPHNFGFSDSEVELTFYVYPGGCGNASAANLSENGNVKEIKCQVRRLDNFVEERKCRIDFIKCDVEGSELFAFKGGLHSIAEFKPVIFTEMLRKWSAKFGYHPNDIITLLAELGYRCYVADGTQLREFQGMNETTAETNFFFLHTVEHAHKVAALVAG